MCGIYGMVSLDGAPLANPHLASLMGRLLRHRGPDHRGQYRTRDALLGADRLQIRDPGPSANQPFFGCSGLCLVCNGEIYNAPTIRARYHRHRYRSRGDLEPIIPLLETKGWDGLGDLDGMFALAAWDSRRRALLLARDSAGEKPLFYLRRSGEIWFASEMQALELEPAARRSLDMRALADYLALGYVREPRTMSEGIYKVPAGTAIEFHGKSITQRRLRTYERPCVAPRAGVPDHNQLRDRLVSAVASQVQANVPVGVFASGGLDSSLVASLAARTIHPTPLHTYAVRFTDPWYDEGSAARRLAGYLGAQHHEVIADAPALTAALAVASDRMAEPLADPALLPTMLLAQRARQDVGVVLTGEGADELFGGYPTYLGHRWAGRLPGTLVTRALSTLVGAGQLHPKHASVWDLAHRFLRQAKRDPPVRHLEWFGTGLIDVLPAEMRTWVLESLPPLGGDATAWALEADFTTYLRDGLLVKVDRAGMLASLETRAPYLDPAVVALSRSLPIDRKVDGIRTKVILREAARGILPAWVLRRRKRGMSVPIATWLRERLAPEVTHIVAEWRSRWSNMAPELPLDRLWREHRTGVANHARALWTALILSHWLERRQLNGGR